MNFFLGGLYVLGRKKKTVWMGRNANFSAFLRPTRPVFGVNWEFSKKSWGNLIAKREDPVREPEIWIPIEAFPLLPTSPLYGLFFCCTFTKRYFFLQKLISFNIHVWFEWIFCLKRRPTSRTGVGVRAGVQPAIEDVLSICFRLSWRFFIVLRVILVSWSFEWCFVMTDLR